MEPSQNYLAEKTKLRRLATLPVADEIMRWSISQTPPYIDAEWLLEIRGEILSLIDSWKHHEMLIKADLSTIVFHQGLHWLGCPCSWEEDENTHPLMPLAMLQVQGDDYLFNLWREKRGKIRVLTALYNFLMGDDTQVINSVFEKNYDSINIHIPKSWVNHLAMSRHIIYQPAIHYISQSLGIDVIKVYDSYDDIEQRLSFFDYKSTGGTPSPISGLGFAPQSATAPNAGLAYDNFYDALVGGFTPALLDTLLGSRHLGMYNIETRQPTPAATAGSWASLFWALKLRGFLPWALSASKGEMLLRLTFKADVSKTRITDIRRADVDIVNRTTAKGTEVARICGLLDEQAVKPAKTSPTAE